MSCVLCDLFEDVDDSVLLIACSHCTSPLAIWREHSPSDRLTAKARLQEFLFAEADHRMWRGRVEFHDEQTNHLRAHFRTITEPYKTIPQELADRIAFEAERCIAWFHDPHDVYLGDFTVGEVKDEDVVRRIRGFQYAMDKEVARYSTTMGAFNSINATTYEGYEKWVEVWDAFHASADFKPMSIQTQRANWRDHAYDGNPLRYVLDTMPFERQRALCQNWTRIWIDFCDANNLDYDNLGFRIRK